MINSINYSDRMNSNDCEDTLALSRANNGILVIGSSLVTAALFIWMESRKNGGFFNLKHYNWIFLLLSIALITLGAIVHSENNKKKCNIKGVASVWVMGVVLFVLISANMGLIAKKKM